MDRLKKLAGLLNEDQSIIDSVKEAYIEGHIKASEYTWEKMFGQGSANSSSAKRELRKEAEKAWNYSNSKHNVSGVGSSTISQNDDYTNQPATVGGPNPWDK